MINIEGESFSDTTEMAYRGRDLLFQSRASSNDAGINKAIKLLVRADVFEAHDTLARYYEAIGDYQEAAKWLRKVAEDPDLGEEAQQTLELWTLQRKIRTSTAPSSTSSYTPPPSSATSKPAAPVAPKPAPAPSSVGTIANGIWQYKAPVLGFINIKHKHEGKYITKGENLIQFKAGKAGSGGQSYDIKAEVDGYITKMADTYQKNAGEILVEITIGKKRLFG